MDYVKAYLPSLLQLVDRASQQILSIYHQTDAFTVDLKADKSPVTQADLLSNQLITETLQQLTPEIPIISEESIHAPFEERKNWEQCWLVDPLDGTREFIGKTNDFSINIALIHQHQPIFGLIHVPVTGITYYASKDQQAFKRLPNGQTQVMHVRQWPDDKPLIIASRRHANNSPLHHFFNYIGNYERISRGSALKFGLIAEGLADLYPRFGETYEWDTAAGHCILETAGGHVVDIQMRPLRYNTRPTLLNPHFIAMGDGLNSLIEWSQRHGK
jgi:3'(2'), 5'-bisphosphate nucleotidase